MTYRYMYMAVSEDDIAIMPIEEVVVEEIALEEEECLNIASRRLQREEITGTRESASPRT